MKNSLKRISILSLLIITCLPINALALTKNETVFSELNTNGTMYKTKVTNHLKITSKEEITDNSILKEIININGDESFTQNENTLKWKTKGKDIYYEGETNKKVPIDINIKYYINNKEETLEKIKNKKGTIKIVISLTNKDKHMTNINGTYEELYTPFVVVAGTIINSKDASNITVTNGKIIETGHKSIISAIASPGLLESLNINKDNLNKIEITYKTEKFSPNNIYIIATPKLLEKQDLDSFNNINNLSNDINKLQQGINEIQKGATSLSKYTKELSKGINTLNQNMPSEKFNKENETKLSELKTNNKTALEKLSNSNELLKEKQKEIETITKDTTNKYTGITTKIIETENSLTQAENAYDTYNTNLESVTAGIQELEYQISQTEDEEMLQSLNEQLGQLKGQKNTLETVVPILYNQKSALEGTIAALNGTKSALEGTLELLNETNQTVGTSVTANENLIALISGNNLVVDSSLSTINKMRALKSGINKINNGAEEISNGTNKLANGINKFNNEGINQLTNYSNIIKKYSNKAEALIDLSNNYNGFASTNSNETVFINKVKTK